MRLQHTPHALIRTKEFGEAEDFTAEPHLASTKEVLIVEWNIATFM